jgi:hypothetical protein
MVTLTEELVDAGRNRYGQVERKQWKILLGNDITTRGTVDYRKAAIGQAVSEAIYAAFLCARDDPKRGSLMAAVARAAEKKAIQKARPPVLANVAQAADSRPGGGHVRVWVVGLLLGREMHARHAWAAECGGEFLARGVGNVAFEAGGKSLVAAALASLAVAAESLAGMGVAVGRLDAVADSETVALLVSGVSVARATMYAGPLAQFRAAVAKLGSPPTPALLRPKRELDPLRLWATQAADDDPHCDDLTLAATGEVLRRRPR